MIPMIYRVYLETTMFNFYFSTQSPDKKADTRRFFEQIAEGKYEPYTSETVVDELKDAAEEKYRAMQELIDKYAVAVLSRTAEAKRLASRYAASGIIPLKYQTDGLHIGIATVNELDFVASYNYAHIVKLKTINACGLINRQEGYHFIGLMTPTEVIDYDTRRT
ncbi:hypothetical protein FACS1894200_02600 [Spirochaetia bacterium]|nr:hypothetical protein FACS1894200_02600 [Spirochaetia bacterium]